MPGAEGPSMPPAQNIRTLISCSAWTLSAVETVCWGQNEEGGFVRICTERGTQKLGSSQSKPDSRIWSMIKTSQCISENQYKFQMWQNECQ